MPQLCLNLLCLAPRYDPQADLAAQLDAAAAAGAELVGLDSSFVKAFLRRGARIQDLAGELAGRGLRCYELLYLECSPRDAAGTMAAAERLAGWAEGLGCEYVLSSTPTPVGDESAELFGRCCDLMAEAGAGLGYEFFPWAPIDRFGRAWELIRRSGRTNTGVVLDCWHFLHGPPGEAGVLETLPLEALAYVQFTDSKPVEPEARMREAETARLFPGDGCLDLRGFAEPLLRRGFDGVVSIEVLSPETRAAGAREFARRCLEGARACWT
ncbi:MAG: sugar phosphate isomerase/epimerase [Proteobacteria bacterium]|nr:sugar phosphate isomerase/epimerase [Pseudomonadota bacterium]